jgi:endonuclease/exonuclease/phosphatase family metal-dependent hydrolase
MDIIALVSRLTMGKQVNSPPDSGEFSAIRKGSPQPACLFIAAISLASVFYIAEASEPVEELISPTLKVMSLNLAHGRKEAMSQLLQRGKTTRTNILEAAELLERNAAHIVALQEADGPSRWSGKFDHVALLAEAANYPYTLSTYHAKTWLFSYGTAILSRVALVDTVQHTFEPSPPTMNKGFTLAKIAWRPQAEADEKLLVDIVSVHLDFSRKKVRERQIDEMTKVLKDRIGPMIILGDFNSGWFSDEAVVREIAERFELKAFQPKAEGLGTFISNHKRLDWILISPELEFVNYQVLEDVVSDHFAVVAEIVVHRKEGCITAQ